MWSQQAILEAQMGRESRYGTEGWNQVAQEDLGNVSDKQKGKSEVSLSKKECFGSCNLQLHVPLSPACISETRVRGRTIWILSIWCYENLQQVFSLKSFVLVTQQISELPTS